MFTYSDPHWRTQIRDATVAALTGTSDADAAAPALWPTVVEHRVYDSRAVSLMHDGPRDDLPAIGVWTDDEGSVLSETDPSDAVTTIDLVIEFIVSGETDHGVERDIDALEVQILAALDNRFAPRAWDATTHLVTSQTAELHKDYRTWAQLWRETCPQVTDTRSQRLQSEIGDRVGVRFLRMTIKRQGACEPDFGIVSDPPIDARFNVTVQT